jgi:hypothetical protein
MMHLDGKIEYAIPSVFTDQTYGNSRSDLLNTGINLAKAMRRAIVRQAVTVIEKRAVRTLNNFRFTVLRDGPDLPVFAHPLTASQLALFLLDAMRVRSVMYLLFHANTG